LLNQMMLLGLLAISVHLKKFKMYLLAETTVIVITYLQNQAHFHQIPMLETREQIEGTLVLLK